MSEGTLKLHEDEAIVLGHVSDLYQLLRAIDETMPKDAILYVEGTSIADDVRGLLAARHARDSQEIAPGTIWPRPLTFHLPLAGTNLAELRDLAEGYAEPEICDHLVVYRNDEVLVSAHDAGGGYVEVARSLPSELVGRFRTALGDSLREHK